MLVFEKMLVFLRECLEEEVGRKQSQVLDPGGIQKRLMVIRLAKAEKTR